MNISQAAVALGQVGGKVTSEKKAKASRANGSLPPKPGSRPCGWPKGKPRKGHVTAPPPVLTTSIPVDEAARAMGKFGGKSKSPVKVESSRRTIFAAQAARKAKKSQAK